MLRAWQALRIPCGFAGRTELNLLGNRARGRTISTGRLLVTQVGYCGGVARGNQGIVSSLGEKVPQTWRRCLSSAATASPEDTDAPREGDEEKEFEVIPMPEGIDESRIGLFEIVGSEGTGPKGNGLRAVFGAHGPPENWIGYGGSFVSAAGGSFGVIVADGRHFKVTAGDTLYVNRMPGEVNTLVTFEKVALIGTVKWSVFGRPLIPGATVTARIESQTKTAKVNIVKFKKRKGYTRRTGHRQPITRLLIESVNYELPSADTLVPHVVEYDPRRPPMPNNMPVL